MLEAKIFPSLLSAPTYVGGEDISFPTIRADCNEPLEAHHCYIAAVAYDLDIRSVAGGRPKSATT
eukprot:scaffold16625_cov131-Skeletonema_menzelii.AAC.1